MENSPQNIRGYTGIFLQFATYFVFFSFFGITILLTTTAYSTTTGPSKPAVSTLQVEWTASRVNEPLSSVPTAVTHRRPSLTDRRLPSTTDVGRSVNVAQSRTH